MAHKAPTCLPAYRLIDRKVEQMDSCVGGVTV